MRSGNKLIGWGMASAIMNTPRIDDDGRECVALGAPDMTDYFSQRAARANLPKALKILQRAGAGKPPMTGDELRAKRGRR